MSEDLTFLEANCGAVSSQLHTIILKRDEASVPQPSEEEEKKEGIEEYHGYIAERPDRETPSERLVFLAYDYTSYDTAFGKGAKAVTPESASQRLDLWFRFSAQTRLNWRRISDLEQVRSLGLARGADAKHLKSISKDLDLPDSVSKAIDEDATDGFFTALDAILKKAPEQTQDSNIVFHVPIFDGQDVDLLQVQIMPEGGVYIMQQVTLARTISAPERDRTILGREVEWANQPDFDLSFKEIGRRHFQRQSHREARLAHKDWRLEGYDTATAEQVEKQAEENLKARLEATDWQTIWPTLDDALAGEAAILAAEVNARFPDLWIDLEAERPAASANKVSLFSIRRLNLSFWPGFALYEIEETHGIVPRRTRILWGKNTDEAQLVRRKGLEAFGVDLAFIAIDNNSSAIHAINAILKTHLWGNRALDYVRFFGDVVHGESGPFNIVERVDDLPWRGLANAAQRKDAVALIHPLRLWPAKSEETDSAADTANDPAEPSQEHPMIISATIIYARALFRALFELQPSGMIEMLEDQRLDTSLDIVPILWTERTHFYLGAPENESDVSPAPSQDGPAL